MKKERQITLFTERTMNVTSESQSQERADEILRHAKPFLDSQKRFWRERMITLFKLYTNGKKSIVEIRMMKVADGGLFWEFHKNMLTDMCLAWWQKEEDSFADRPAMTNQRV